MANDSLPPPIRGTSDDKESLSETPNTTPALQWIKQPIAGLGLFLILIALPTVLKFNINPAAVVLICAGATLLILSRSLLRVRRHWAHFLMLYGSIGLIAACAAWLGWYYSFMPQDPVAAGSVAGFVMFPMILLCGAVVPIASGACFVSAVVVLFVKTDSTGTLREDRRKTMPRRIPQLVGVSLVGAALIILFVTVYPRVSPDLLIHEIDADAVTITGCQKGASGKLVIPQAIEDKPVTRIGAAAFANCTKLTTVTIPDGVTSIGTKAFEKCYSLREVTIPASVTSIGAGAFYYCEDLVTITIPDGVTSIEEKTYSMCLKLTSVTFLGDAPKVAENAFQHSSSVINGLSLTIYRRPEAKGWGETFAGMPVKLISEKP